MVIKLVVCLIYWKIFRICILSLIEFDDIKVLSKRGIIYVFM